MVGNGSKGLLLGLGKMKIEIEWNGLLLGPKQNNGEEKNMNCKI